MISYCNKPRLKNFDIQNVIAFFLFISIVGGTDVSQEASETAAMFLLQHFKNTVEVTAVDTKILKNNFGPFPASAAAKCCETVQKLVKIFPDGVLDNEKETSEVKTKRYGSKLKINVADEEMMISDESDSDYEPDKADQFVDQFKEQLNLNQTKGSNDVVNMQNLRMSSGTNHKPDSQVESSWLLNQCQIYFPGHESPETMATALYDVLISNGNDAEIQNELFELVGFDAFDFIGELLKRRKELVSTQDTRESGVKLKSSSKKPLIASQVTIQVCFPFHSEICLDS